MIGSTSIAQNHPHHIKKKKQNQNQNICLVPNNALKAIHILPMNQTLFIINNGQNSSIVSRKSNNKFGYGSKMVLQPNGTIIESYTAPCGNDANIHRNVGSWKATRMANGNIHLRTSIPIKNYGRDLILIKQGRDYIMKPMMKKKTKHMQKQRIMHRKHQVIKHG
jgi:hypothetical protein